MSTASLQDLEQQIRELLNSKGATACQNISCNGAFGYYIRPNEERGWVTIYYVETRPDVPTYSAQQEFRRAYWPIIVATFGYRRVSMVTGKIRVVGKLRPVAGWRVKLRG